MEPLGLGPWFPRPSPVGGRPNRAREFQDCSDCKSIDLLTHMDVFVNIFKLRVNVHKTQYLRAEAKFGEKELAELREADLFSSFVTDYLNIYIYIYVYKEVYVVYVSS